MFNLLHEMRANSADVVCNCLMKLQISYHLSLDQQIWLPNQTKIKEETRL